MATRKQWKVGDLVRWNGAAYYFSPRYYRGTITKIDGGLAYVEDNEWHAQSAVRLDRLMDDSPIGGQ